MKNTKTTYYVYKITNLITNEISLGVTTINSTDVDSTQDYTRKMSKIIRDTGVEHFKREILSSWENKESASKERLRIRTKVYITQIHKTMTDAEKQHILTNNLFDKRPTPTKEDKKQYHKEYNIKNKEVISARGVQYRLDNDDKIKKYREDNKLHMSLKQKEWRLKVIDSMREEWNKRSRIYRENNRELLNARQNEYYKIKLEKQATEKVIEGHNGSDWIFYTLLFTHKTLGFKFYKYGITCNTIHSRYRQGGYSNFNFEVIDFQYGDKAYIKALERKHLNATYDTKFIFPKNIKFGGKTECRTKLASSINIV